MNKINIIIPDNLSPEEEMLMIAEQLGRKLLPSSQKTLGSGYEIKHLETQINIVREPVEKPIITHECSVCQTVFDHHLSKILYTNYGGKIKKLRYCSDECRKVVMDITGLGRSAIRKTQLTPLYR